MNFLCWVMRLIEKPIKWIMIEMARAVKRFVKMLSRVPQVYLTSQRNFTNLILFGSSSKANYH